MTTETRERKVYFQEGPFLVTSELVRARNRTIQLSTIETVEIRRRLFLMALGLCAGLIGFALTFGDLLYWHEWILMVGLAAAVITISWNLATLSVRSKLTRGQGWSVIGRAPQLARMRNAIEEAMIARG
jgi:hypothetical protein